MRLFVLLCWLSVVLCTNLQIVLYDSGTSVCHDVLDTSMLNQPIQRQCKIMDALQRWILADNVLATWEMVKSSNSLEMDSLLSIHKPAYLNFLLNCWSSYLRDGKEPEVITADGRRFDSTRRDECDFYNPDVNDVHHEWRLEDVAVVKHAANLMVQVESSTRSVIVASTTFPGHHARYDRYNLRKQELE